MQKPIRKKIISVAPYLWRFAWRVIRNFLKNRGVLLAGGVAYNTMLSIVPLFALIIIGLSNFFDTGQLLSIISSQLDFLLPGQTGAITETVRTALESRSIVGGVGIVVLLFFSSLAFRMLEEAIASIFNVPGSVNNRSLWFSALIPYIYLIVFAFGIILLTAINAFLEAIADRGLIIAGRHLYLTEAPRIGIYLLDLIGLSLLFTSIYKMMPVIEIQFKRALVGGIIAALLWDVVRRILVWYFSNISLINVLYGSLATVIIVLLAMEIAAIIILIGAQVIAELEMAADAGVPWYEDPRQKIEGAPFESRANGTSTNTDSYYN